MDTRTDTAQPEAPAPACCSDPCAEAPLLRPVGNVLRVSADVKGSPFDPSAESTVRVLP